jgi:serine/threonine-protein kinase
VGVTLFEMLTGSRPFVVNKPKDPFAWRHILLNERPARLSDYLPAIPEGLQAVVDRALARDKRDRYHSAMQFRDDLIAVAESRLPDHAAEATVRNLISHTPLGRFESAPTNGAKTAAVAEPASAEVVSDTEKAKRRLPLLRRKEALPAQIELEPQAVYFGDVRKGDEHSARIVFRQREGSGRPEAVVASTPGWVSVSPTRINRRRQALTITAHSAQVWETGDFQDHVALRTEAGEVRIPVGIRVLPPRRRFRDVAHWLIPLFASAVLPAATVAFLGRYTDARFLVPAAALASALLAAMLLQVESAADLGTEEKVAGGVILAVMTAVLGVVIGAGHRSSVSGAIYPVIGVGVPLAALFLVQCLTRRHWKVWAAVVVILALVTSYTFVNALA